jgi:hypothetical protein
LPMWNNMACGQCYDHDFRRLSPIFGEKNWRSYQKPLP